MAGLVPATSIILALCLNARGRQDKPRDDASVWFIAIKSALINAGPADPARVVFQFECLMGNSPNAFTQLCRLLSQTECFGAGKSGSANDPTATASHPGNASASK